MAILLEITLEIAARVRFEPAVIWFVSTIANDAPQRHILFEG